MEKVTNEEVLVHARVTRRILKMIWQRKHRWFGCVLRHVNFLLNIIEGRLIRRATRNRKKIALLYDIILGRFYGQLKDLVSDRLRWRQDSK